MHFYSSPYGAEALRVLRCPEYLVIKRSKHRPKLTMLTMKQDDRTLLLQCWEGYLLGQAFVTSAMCPYIQPILQRELKLRRAKEKSAGLVKDNEALQRRDYFFIRKCMEHEDFRFVPV